MSLSLTIEPGTPPKRGELYRLDPGPAIGHEQAGRRPYLVVSSNHMNKAPVQLVIAVPLTTTERPSPLHVRIEPDESGLERVSYAMPEMARSVSTLRFERHLGRVPMEVADSAARHTGALIGLGRVRF